jgi:hypothetical protein
MQAAMIAAAAAAAAQYSQIAAFNPTLQDPGVKMARNLDKLRTNPVTVQEGLDNRFTILHDARFLGGAVTSGTGMWLAARKVIGLEGLTPLANYDLACMGLAGSVTTKGCIEAHNPGSQNLCLKQFSPENLCTTAGAARKFTLADDDGAISVGEHMKEITEMTTLQHAMRALCGLTRLIMPWNLSFEAIHGFLYATNFGLPELKDDPLRVPKLVKFINYVLGVNAAAWQCEAWLHISHMWSSQTRVWHIPPVSGIWCLRPCCCSEPLTAEQQQPEGRPRPRRPLRRRRWPRRFPVQQQRGPWRRARRLPVWRRPRRLPVQRGSRRIPTRRRRHGRIRRWSGRLWRFRRLHLRHATVWVLRP